MARHLNLRLVVCAALAALMTLAASSAASANTVSDSTDPNTTVTVSLTSNGVNPDIANIGDRVTARVAVKASNFFTGLDIHLFVLGDWIGTKAGVEKDKFLRLKPGKTWEWEAKFKVRNTTPLGTFNLSALAVSAGSVSAVSSASASIMAVNNGIDSGDESIVLEENDAGDDD